VAKESLEPIFSTRPPTIGCLDSMSKIWYFRELLPQFKAIMQAINHPFNSYGEASMPVYFRKQGNIAEKKYQDNKAKKAGGAAGFIEKA
jgi:hypothetical protein